MNNTERKYTRLDNKIKANLKNFNMEGLLSALDEIIEDIEKATHKGAITLISSSRQDLEGVGLFEKYFYHHINSNGCFFIIELRL
jgi:hypothetical protein